MQTLLSTWTFLHYHHKPLHCFIFFLLSLISLTFICSFSYLHKKVFRLQSDIISTKGKHGTFWLSIPHCLWWQHHLWHSHFNSYINIIFLCENKKWLNSRNTNHRSWKFYRSSFFHMKTVVGPRWFGNFIGNIILVNIIFISSWYC